MPLYFLLGTLSYAGQKRLLDNPDLAIESIRDVDVEGAEVLGQYAVLGKYDFVMLAEADDNEAAARLSLELGVSMGMHVETLPAIAIGVLIEDESDEDRVPERYAVTPSGEAGSQESSEDDWRLPDRE